MKLTVDILSCCALLFTIIGVFCKDKSKAMLFVSIYNFIVLITYFLLEQFSGSVMIILALVRSITFLIFSRKKLKPNIFVFIGFELVSITALILVWESYLTIFLLVNIVASIYTYWQDNLTIVRIGFFICGITLVFYNFFINAYVLLVAEIIYALSAIISIMKNDIIPFIKSKKQKKIGK